MNIYFVVEENISFWFINYCYRLMCYIPVSFREAVTSTNSEEWINAHYKTMSSESVCSCVFVCVPAGYSWWCQMLSWHAVCPLCFHLVGWGYAPDTTPTAPPTPCCAAQWSPSPLWPWWCVLCKSPPQPGRCHWSNSPVSQQTVSECKIKDAKIN